MCDFAEIELEQTRQEAERRMEAAAAELAEAEEKLATANGDLFYADEELRARADAAEKMAGVSMRMSHCAACRCVAHFLVCFNSSGPGSCHS